MFRATPTSATWWGQNAPQVIPSQVCVLDNGRVVPGYFPANVTDEVTILLAEYTPATATLSVNAVTSDCFTNPKLTLDGFGAMTLNVATCTNTLSIANLLAPPAKVSVTSLRGGVDSMNVSTAVGTPVLMNVVVTNADTLTMAEDCSATAPQTPTTVCVAGTNSPVVDVLANDTLNGAPVVSGYVTVALSTLPKTSWIGYKLHADVNDGGLPVSIALTSASVHDSQVAIPLIKMTSAKVDYLYDLMDAAYDARAIYQVSRSLGHVPIIDKNPRGKDAMPMAPHEVARYKERTAAERFNSRMKEEFGADNVMVRGPQKVRMHLMFGLLALFADQLIKLVT